MPSRSPIDPKRLPRPRALDLFCGGGGAGEGLRRAGFAAVVGIDIRDCHKTSYEHAPTLHFRCADVTTLTPAFVAQFDFVHASPPCQAFTTMVYKHQRDEFLERWHQNGRHINHIPAVRALLEASGTPFCIENVQGARAHLKGPLLKLCGTHFNLRVFRHRLFEFGNGVAPPANPPACNHDGCSVGLLGKGLRPPRKERYATDSAAGRKAGDAPAGFVAVEKRFPSHGERVDHVYVGADPEMQARIRATYGRGFARSIKEALRVTQELVPLTETEKEAERARYERERQAGLPAPGTTQFFPVYGLQKARGLTEDWRDAMGITWAATRDEVREAIPPAYTDYIATHLMPQLLALRRRPRRPRQIACAPASPGADGRVEHERDTEQ